VRVFEFLVTFLAKPNSVKRDVEAESEDQQAEKSGAEVRYHHDATFYRGSRTSLDSR
jgi:hypothetical protein